MEKYILLFRGSDVYQSNQPSEALEILTKKMLGWVSNLVREGRHVSSNKFQRTGAQVAGTQRKITTDVFGADKEVIGGSTTVLANNLEEAIKIAESCPILQTDASIEVRPFQSV